MNTTQTTSSFQTLLHPWNKNDTTPPAILALELENTKLLIHFPDTRHAIAIEINAGQPELHIYHPNCNEPLSVQWTDKGFTIDPTYVHHWGYTVTLTT